VSDFVEGLGFGLILQISVGPVCIAVLHKGLTQGFVHAFAMVWGAALVDALYILLSMIGISALLQLAPARMVIGLAGALLLLYFGLRYLSASPSATRIEQRSESPLRSFRFGVGLTLTNPLTILFWAGVLGAMLSSQPFTDRQGALFFAAGCVAATLFFLSGVALAGHLLERVLNERLILWLNRAVGVFLIGFALKLCADLLLSL
jgi:threonine/homoserine/homoserine lactone efflux protein